MWTLAFLDWFYRFFIPLSLFDQIKTTGNPDFGYFDNNKIVNHKIIIKNAFSLCNIINPFKYIIIHI